MDLGKELDALAHVVPHSPEREVHAVGCSTLRDIGDGLSQCSVIVWPPEKMPPPPERRGELLDRLYLPRRPGVPSRNWIRAKIGGLEVFHKFGRDLKMPSHCEGSSKIITAMS